MPARYPFTAADGAAFTVRACSYAEAEACALQITGGPVSFGDAPSRPEWPFTPTETLDVDGVTSLRWKDANGGRHLEVLFASGAVETIARVTGEAGGRFTGGPQWHHEFIGVARRWEGVQTGSSTSGYMPSAESAQEAIISRLRAIRVRLRTPDGDDLLLAAVAALPKRFVLYRTCDGKPAVMGVSRILKRWVECPISNVEVQKNGMKDVISFHPNFDEARLAKMSWTPSGEDRLQ